MATQQSTLSAASDPWAALRRIKLSPVQTRAAYTQMEEAGDGGQARAIEHPAYSWVDLKGLESNPTLGQYQTKYNNDQAEVMPDGRLRMKVQQPGAHKYDTAEAYFKQDPATGEWVLDGTPTNTREVSTAAVTKDYLEKTAGIAAAVFGGAYGLEAMGAGTGATTAGGGLTADMGAAMAASADGGALAASGQGLAAAGGGTAAGAGTISGGGGITAAGTTAGGTAAGVGSTGLGTAATTAAPSAGGGLMSGMTASDWINLGGLVYSAANRPDPVDTSGIEAQAARSAGIAERQQTLAEKQYADQLAIFNEFKPLLQQQITGAIEAQNKSNQRSDQQWADYMQTWRPTEQALAEKSLNWATPGRMQAAADEASGAVASNYDAQRTQQREAMIAAGVDPSAITSLEAAGRLVEAKDRAGAATTARRTVESQGMAYLDNAARFGRNMPSTGLAAAGLAGQQGQQAQGAYGTLANASAQPAAAANPIFTSAVGSGNTAAGLYSNAANLQAASQQQQFNHDMGMIGGLNQWANSSRWLGGFTSSKKTKDVKGKVTRAADKVEKSGVWKWSYKPGLGDADTKDRMGPMAEDLKKVAPEVSDGKRVDGISLLGLHHAAVGDLNRTVKKQAKKIAALERKLSLADA